MMGVAFLLPMVNLFLNYMLCLIFLICLQQAGALGNVFIKLSTIAMLTEAMISAGFILIVHIMKDMVFLVLVQEILKITILIR